MKTKNIVSNVLVVPTTGPEAFAAVQPEIDAVPDSELVQISVDIPYSHEIALGAAERIAPYLSELEKLPGLDMRLVRMMPTYAIAARHAHLLATNPEEVGPELPALIEQASDLREKMLLQLELLALFDYCSPARVAVIRSGSGHVDLANDLEHSAVLFTEMGNSVKGKVIITEETVARAYVLANRLHFALGVKRVGSPGTIRDPQLTRQRAFTLFVRAYEECERGIAYIRKRHGDAELITPSIYVKQRKRSASTQSDVGPPEVVAPAVMTNSAPASNGSSASSNTPASNGTPGPNGTPPTTVEPTS